LEKAGSRELIPDDSLYLKIERSLRSFFSPQEKNTINKTKERSFLI
jgi:hypothetical protein